MPVVINLSTLNGTNGFVINGESLGDRAGTSVASAGDINGDGIDDFIIGAPGASGPDANFDYEFGAGYVVFGKAGSFGAAFDLSSLDGSNGFKIGGLVYGDTAGTSVASAGDVNGDGVDDLIIGAPGGNSGGGDGYVLFGKTMGFSAEFDLSSLDGTNGFRFNGGNSSDWTGDSVASAGDINGDGFDDLIIGAAGVDGPGNYYDYDRGASYVVFGTNSGFAANLDLTTLNGTNGFRIMGEVGYDRSGGSVASAGDINCDGFDDLIIGANGVDGSNIDDIGASYIVFGKATGFTANLNLSSLNGSNGFQVNGVNEYDRSGTSVASAGDVNGDGIDDIIIGARSADSGGYYNQNSGASYVVFGKTTGFSSNFNLKTLDGTNGFLITGAQGGENLGVSVAGAGDFNGDGIGDLIVGASYAYSNGKYYSGASYLIFGRNGGFSDQIDLGNLSAGDGFRINGAAVYDNSGASVASAGDINGDGFDDLVIGAPYATNNGSQNGAAYILFGHATLPNSAPEGADNTIALFGNSSHTFTAADFGFSDQDGNLLHSIIISTLPTNGSLRLNGSTFAAGKVILVGAIEDLVWTPEKDDSGPGKGSFTFQVVDDGGTADGGQNEDLSPNMINFNITADDYTDTASTTGIVTVNGNPVSGEIEYADDVDFFKVELQAGNYYVFDLISTNGIDPTLQLYDHYTDLIEEDDDGGSGSNSRITFYAYDGGTYYLGAKGYDGNELGTYEISAKAAEDDYPNNFDTTTGVVTVGAMATTGEIQFQQDVDLFKVNLQAGKTYVFDLTDTSGIDTYLELYGPDFDFINDDDDGGPGTNSRITYTANQTGTYFLGAMTSYGSDIGTYKIEAQLYMKPGNHAPALTGTATVLDNGTEDTYYIISTGALLAGFSDDDGDDLSVVALTSSNGNAYFDEYDETFTIIPTDDYQGAVTLSYFVVDGYGGSVAATSTFNFTDVTDYYTGHRGRDNFVGTNGHDIFNGKAGRDTMTGKGGSDTFIFWKNYDRDVIRDFDAVGPDHDILNIKRLDTVKNFRDLMHNHISEKHGNVIINGLNGDVVTLKGVDLDDLGRSDFIF